MAKLIVPLLIRMGLSLCQNTGGDLRISQAWQGPLTARPGKMATSPQPSRSRSSLPRHPQTGGRQCKLGHPWSLENALNHLCTENIVWCSLQIAMNNSKCPFCC